MLSESHMIQYTKVHQAIRLFSARNYGRSLNYLQNPLIQARSILESVRLSFTPS